MGVYDLDLVYNDSMLESAKSLYAGAPDDLGALWITMLKLKKFGWCRRLSQRFYVSANDCGSESDLVGVPSQAG